MNARPIRRSLSLHLFGAAFVGGVDDLGPVDDPEEGGEGGDGGEDGQDLEMHVLSGGGKM